MAIQIFKMIQASSCLLLLALFLVSTPTVYATCGERPNFCYSDNFNHYIQRSDHSERVVDAVEAQQRYLKEQV